MVEEHKRQAANTLLVILACSSVEMFFYISLVSWKCLNTAAAWNQLFVVVCIIFGWNTFLERDIRP